MGLQEHITIGIGYYQLLSINGGISAINSWYTNKTDLWYSISFIPWNDAALQANIAQAGGGMNLNYNGGQWKESADVEDNTNTTKEKRQQSPNELSVVSRDYECGLFNSLHGSSQGSDEFWPFQHGFYKYVGNG